MKRTLFLLVLLFLGCAPEKPACSPEALAKIESDYINEAEASCGGYTFDTCLMLPEIREKYRAKRQEWVSCQ